MKNERVDKLIRDRPEMGDETGILTGLARKANGITTDADVDEAVHIALGYRTLVNAPILRQQASRSTTAPSVRRNLDLR